MPPASGNLEFFKTHFLKDFDKWEVALFESIRILLFFILSLWDRASETMFSNGLGHNRSKVSGSWAEIDGVRINFSRSIFPFMSKIMRVAVLTDLELGSCSRIWDSSEKSAGI